MNAWSCALAVIVLAACHRGTAPPPPATPPSPVPVTTSARAPASIPRPSAAFREPLEAFTRGRHRGVCYAHSMRRGRGYGSPDSADSLKALAALGVDSISLTPFGFQRTNEDTEIRWGGTRIDETDERLSGATAQARALGMRVMLKPHIWLRPPAWPGTVDPGTAEGWATWFANYRAFILHYAALAERERMDSLCIGNELARSSVHEKEWRALIAEIRGVYHGPLTYGATAEEVFEVPFWDALDFIGVSAYYPLVDAPTPSAKAVAEGWRPLAARFQALAAQHQRKVVFTEIGYRSADRGAWRHWEITDDFPVNLEAQAAAYEGFFDAVWNEPWFGGAYFWKWFTHVGHSGPESNDFEFEGKPAEQVLRKNYRRATPRH